MTTEYLAMQAGLFAEFQNFWAMALRGRPPTFGEASALADRAAAYGMRETERAAKLGGLGLAPIHRQATSNARRLKRASARGARRGRIQPIADSLPGRYAQHVKGGESAS